MNEIAQRAITLWGMHGASCELVAERENVIFRVRHHGAAYALRVHRDGYRTASELCSELEWMAHLRAFGLSVPNPISSTNGANLETVDGRFVDLLTWIDGEVLLTSIQSQDTPTTFFRVGAEMARLHDASDQFVPSETFERCHWDIQGLLGQEPLWDRFWDNPELTSAQAALLSEFRATAASDLNEVAQELDYGLIHADMVAENILVSDTAVGLIDFDDGGFGFRLFDLATALLKHRSRHDFHDIQGAIVAGYKSQRDVDLALLDLMLAIRAMTYVGWNITRMHEVGGLKRNARFIETACDLAAEYLAK